MSFASIPFDGGLVISKLLPETGGSLQSKLPPASYFQAEPEEITRQFIAYRRFLKTAEQYERDLPPDGRPISPDMYLPLLQLFGGLFVKAGNLFDPQTTFDLRSVPFRDLVVSGMTWQHEIMHLVAYNIIEIEKGKPFYAPAISEMSAILQFVEDRITSHYVAQLRSGRQTGIAGLLHMFKDRFLNHGSAHGRLIERQAAWLMQQVVVETGRDLAYAERLFIS